jgi:hypothetical protein
MSYFLTTDDIKNGRKCLLGARIVTPVGMAGRRVKLAEDGKWHMHESLRPLAEEQIRGELVAAMSGLVAGKHISTLKAKGRGVEFVLNDNTRVGLTITSGENLELSVTDSDGQRIL